MDELDRHFGEALPKMRVAVQEYAASNPEFLLALAERSQSVTRVPLYEWALPEDVKPLRECVLGIARRYADIVLFTTAVQIIHLFQVATGMGCADSLRAGLQSSVILSIGPSTSEELRSHGLAPDFEPSHPNIASLLCEAAEHMPQILEQKRTGSSVSLAPKPYCSPRPLHASGAASQADAQDLHIASLVGPASRTGMDFLHEIGSRMAAADPFHAVLDRIVEFVSQDHSLRFLLHLCAREGLAGATCLAQSPRQSGRPPRHAARAGNYWLGGRTPRARLHSRPRAAGPALQEVSAIFLRICLRRCWRSPSRPRERS